MKISAKDLKAMISESVKKKLDEQVIQYKDILPGAPDEFYKYAEKVEKFLLDTAEKAEKLRAEGKEIMRPDLGGYKDSSAKIGERNRYLNKYVASLHKIKGSAIQLLESIIREA